MNQTRTNYQSFINDIYTSQKHILGLVTKLAQRMDDLDARLRSIKDDQNINLAAVKNSLDGLCNEIHHQYNEEAEEIDELNDVLAGELENLNMTSIQHPGYNIHNGEHIHRHNGKHIYSDDSNDSNDSNNMTNLDNENADNTILHNGQVTDLENLVSDFDYTNTSSGYDKSTNSNNLDEPLIL